MQSLAESAYTNKTRDDGVQTGKATRSVRRYSSVPLGKPVRRKSRVITLLEVMIFMVAAGLFTGAAFSLGTVVEISRLKAQVSQIARFDEAVAGFYAKYGGLPGDLLSAKAEREGITAGDGTPSHSDGDGKISPCNPGWQHHLGCETALFWSQLAETGFIDGDFNADARFSDERLMDVSVTMAPYLPVSPLRDGVYVSVWNSDPEQPSRAPQLPYGNYFEISSISGIIDGSFIDNPRALTAPEALAIDRKMDDGSPDAGRVMVNGDAIWPDNAWGSLARTGSDMCVSKNSQYNLQNYHILGKPICHLAIALACCDKK